MTDKQQPDKALGILALETFGATLEVELEAALATYRESPYYPQRSTMETTRYLRACERALRGFEASCLRWGVE